MRKLTAEVSVDHLDNGASLLRIKSATGELLGVELDAARTAALRDALPHQAEVATTDKPAAARRKPAT